MLERLYPVFVAIETINACNARCPFCPLFQGDSQLDRDIRPAKIMDDALFERIVHEIATWDTRPGSIFLNMNGEPLLDPHFADRLELLFRHGLGPLIELQTNGQFLTEQAAQAILDAQSGRLVLGFDGATKEVYQAHRVRCDYDRVLDNIKRFVRLRNQSGGRTQVAVQSSGRAAPPAAASSSTCR